MNQQAAENDFVDRLLADTPAADLAAAAQGIVQASGCAVGGRRRSDRAAPCLAVARCGSPGRRNADAGRSTTAPCRDSSEPESSPTAASRRGPSTDSRPRFRPLPFPTPTCSCTAQDCWRERTAFPRRSPICGWPCSCSLPMRFFVKSEKLLDRIIGVGPLAAAPHGKTRNPGQFHHVAVGAGPAGGRLSLRPEAGDLRRRLWELPAGDTRPSIGLVSLPARPGGHPAEPPRSRPCRPREAASRRGSLSPGCANCGRFCSSAIRAISCRSASIRPPPAPGEVWKMRCPRDGEE